MNKGMSLQSLAAELERQAESRRDFLAPQGVIDAVVIGDDVRLEVRGMPEPLALTPHAHKQMGEHLEIPAKYYQRMAAEAPDLLATNVNRWLDRDPENRRMLRTLDGKIRAVLSPKYRPLDNLDLASAVLPTLIEQGAEVVSAQLTETRLYVKAILPSLSSAVPMGGQWVPTGVQGVDRGNIVAAVTFSNSEVGAGSLRIEPGVFTAICTNLAMLKKAVMRAYHVGRGASEAEDWSIYRDETRAADDRAFWLKVGDATRNAFSPEGWAEAVRQVRGAAEAPIVRGDLAEVIEMAIEQLALPSGTSAPILRHLAAGGDLTKWGLSSAITRVAGEVDDYEQATDLERAGGEVLALPTRAWERIAGRELTTA